MTNNKTVLVTGGAGGIGSAICRKFAEAGYAVIITYNGNLEKAEKLCNSLVGEGHSVFHAPVNDAKRLSELSSFIESEYGKLDVLVNNAGITTPVAHDDLDGLSDEWIDRIFEINVRGTFAMIRACKALLLKSKDALVVNISSVAAISGVGSNVAYCASKAAIDSITRSLARALAPNIRVVSVSPGWVLGEYTKNIDPQYLKMQIDKTPLGRLAIAEDVANTVFVLTTHLTFTTGSIIPVDGGRLL
ncbi:3-oxoacyl-[acyl-carrier protein] reductase [Arcicella rosea]|uniref:SDR family NAD(P)-dependent oxidoreductase n=1 Tax=Arcicella rosea TaxID=502909 RepID=UPI00345D8EDB